MRCNYPQMLSVWQFMALGFSHSRLTSHLRFLAPCLTKELRSLEWQLPMPPHFRGRRSALGDPQYHGFLATSRHGHGRLGDIPIVGNPQGKPMVKPLIKPKVLMLPGRQTPQELALLFFPPWQGKLSRSKWHLQEQCNTSWGYSYCQTKHGGYTCPISCKDNETLCAIQRSRLSRP
jgi:hypothetical protein